MIYHILSLLRSHQLAAHKVAYLIYLLYIRNMKSGVYIIRNLVNNKAYIGKSKNINQRKNTHFNALRLNKHTNQHLQNSYNKYGKKYFEFNILEYCEESLLPTKEMYYIGLYKNNYNIIQSIDNRHDFPQEMRNKMKQSKINNGLTVFIYSYNIDTKEIIKWTSIKECSINLNINRRAIQKVLKNKDLKYKNYQFSKHLNFIKRKNCSNRCKNKVLVYDVNNNLIHIFESVTETSKLLKINRVSIRKAFNKNCICKNKYKFVIEEESSN